MHVKAGWQRGPAALRAAVISVRRSRVAPGRNCVAVALAAVVLASACGPPSSESGAEASEVATVTSTDGVPIAYEVHGTGQPALVFVHGWSCDRSYWDAQVGPFSRDFQVVTVDLAGHGGSGFGRERWTVEAFGADVAAVVEAMALERVILIGHSLGGDVILEAARRLPGRVDGLVWVDVYRELGSPRTLAAIEERVAPFRADFRATTVDFVRSIFAPDADEALVEGVAQDMASAPPEIATEVMERALIYGRDVADVVDRIDLPIIAINAEEPARLPTDVPSLERYGVEVVMMEGVGHFPMMEDAERFNAILRDVIDRLLGS